jgi:hypothetical protein
MGSIRPIGSSVKTIPFVPVNLPVLHIGICISISYLWLLQENRRINIAGFFADADRVRPWLIVQPEELRITHL